MAERMGGKVDAASPTISVVIPTWMEAPLNQDAVRCAREIGDEIIVADAGSLDGTASAAERQTLVIRGCREAGAKPEFAIRPSGRR